MSGGQIHDEHPFVAPPDLRDPARRLRGRLASPVTILTAGEPSNPVGLTVSSLLVAEGQPARLVALVGDTTDFWYVISETGRFVAHVLSTDDREVADRLAGLRPAPGGAFGGLTVEDGPWGPVLGLSRNRAYCTLDTASPTGYHHLVVAAIDRIDLDDLGDPLVYFRGRYRRLERSSSVAQ